MYDETHARIADRAAIPTTANECLQSWRPCVAQPRTCTQAQVRLALRILILQYSQAALLSSVDVVITKTTID